MARTGRRPGSPDTRERVRHAAQEAFAASGFEQATIREIARRAGVDPALVHHYFGSKEELFVASMQLPEEIGTRLPAVLGGERAGVGQRLADLAMSLWEDEPTRLVILGIARSATSDPRAAAALRDLLESTLLPRVRGLGVDQPELRATLAWSQLVGLAIGRYVLGVGVLADVEPGRLAAIAGPLLQQALTGPLPAAPDGSPDRRSEPGANGEARAG
jgi:AcrR family transcriptional regulator